MTVNYPYLTDRDFLSLIDAQQIKEHFIRIFVLDWKQEQPIAEVQGLVTSGTLNINGSSTIRRTCNLTMSVSETDYTTNNDGYKQIEQLLGYNKKVFLEVGYKNFTNQQIGYPIIWFPLETYVLTGASFTHNLQGVTVSLQLKDKMCLLNGLIGGTLPACVDFAQQDTLDKDGKTQTIKTPIIQIIRELLHHYGNEAEERIVINGIPLREKQVVQFDSEMCSYTDQFQITVFKDPERIPVGAGPMYNNPQCGKEYDLQKAYIDAGVYSSISEASKKSFRYTFTPNDYIGYTYTDFVFPGELTTNYNNSVCDVLDKIKNAFSNFEYFYKNDTFYFQEKNNFLNQRDIFNVLDSSDTASNIITDGYINGEQISIDIGEFLSPYNGGQDVSTLASYWLNVNPKSQYVFNDNNIVVAFSNTPKYENIKNDFVVWGNRKNGSNKNAVRYHLAIDKKPEFGNQYLIAKGRASEDGSLISDYDNSYANGVSFIITTGSVEDTTALPFPGCVGVTYALVHGSESSDRENVIKNALLGINKGYDLNSGPLCSSEGADVNQLNDSSIALYYWDPSAIDENKCWVKYPNGTGRLKIVTTKDWRDEIYLNGLYSDVKGTTPSYYQAEIKAEWPKIYNSWTGSYLKSFIKDPSSADWYLDLIESNAFDAISVPAIGRRSKVVQDSSVNCVFEGIIPEFVYINCGKLTPVHHGEYTMLNLNGVRPVKGGSLSTLEGRDYSAGTIEQFFKKEIGLRIQDGQTTNYVNNAKEVSVFRGSYEQGQQIIADRNQANANNLIPIGVPDFIGDYIHVAPGQNSALYVVRELLTEQTSLQNTITIECLPIYYLEPNTRITVHDPASQIEGDFIIDTITCPLNATGNMTITASKINDKL